MSEASESSLRKFSFADFKFPTLDSRNPYFHFVNREFEIEATGETAIPLHSREISYRVDMAGDRMIIIAAFYLDFGIPFQVLGPNGLWMDTEVGRQQRAAV